MEVIYENFMGNFVLTEKVVRIKEIIELREVQLQKVNCKAKRFSRKKKIQVSRQIHLFLASYRKLLLPWTRLKR